MKANYDVTFTHFVIEDGVAKACAGTASAGRIDGLELLQILMIFQDISPLQSFVGEPLISISVRGGGRYTVKTDLHKLILYDTRQMQVPGRVLEAASILIEIEDEVRFVRKKVEASLNEAAVHHRQDLRHASEHAQEHAEAPTSAVHWLLLGGAGLLLGLSVLVYANLVPATTVAEPLADPQEQALQQHMLQGTYLSGLRAGDYGIVVDTEGRMDFLELGVLPPKRYRVRYELVRINGQLCLLSDGHEPVWVERGTLRMGTLRFQKQ